MQLCNLWELCYLLETPVNFLLKFILCVYMYVYLLGTLQCRFLLFIRVGSMVSGSLASCQGSYLALFLLDVVYVHLYFPTCVVCVCHATALFLLQYVIMIIHFNSSVSTQRDQTICWYTPCVRQLVQSTLSILSFGSFLLSSKV